MTNPYYYPVLFSVLKKSPKTRIWWIFFRTKMTKKFLRAKKIIFQKRSEMKIFFKNEIFLQFWKSLLLTVHIFVFLWKKDFFWKVLFSELKNREKNTKFFQKYFSKKSKKIFFLVQFCKNKNRRRRSGARKVLKKLKIIFEKYFSQKISKSHFCKNWKNWKFFLKKIFFLKKTLKSEKNIFLLPEHLENEKVISSGLIGGNSGLRSGSAAIFKNIFPKFFKKNHIFACKSVSKKVFRARFLCKNFFLLLDALISSM